jgi:hypothetical protein
MKNQESVGRVYAATSSLPDRDALEKFLALFERDAVLLV